MMGFEALFNFSNSQPLDEAIAKIQLLEDTYEGMIQGIINSNKRLSVELTVVTDSAKLLAASINQSNVSLQKYEDQVMATAKDSEDLMSRNIALRKTLDDNDKTLNKLTDGLKAATKAKDDLKASTTAEAGSFDDLKKKLTNAEKAYKGLGDSVDESIKEEHLQNVKEASAQYNKVSKSLVDAKKSAVLAAGSYNEFAKRVADGKKALKEMEGGLDGTSQEFKDLQKFVSEGSQKLKDWDNVVGDNQRNVGNYEGALKDLKLQLKAAKDEMIGLAAAGKENSVEFQEASKKAGALKDELDDVTKATANLSGSKLENLSSTFGDVFNKLKSGDFKGGLDAAKQFAAVSKTITFREAAQSVKQFGQTVGIVGKAILTNPIFLMAAVLTGIALAWKKVNDQAREFHEENLKNMESRVQAIQDTYALEIHLADLAGKKTFDIRKQAAEETIAVTTKGINEILSNSESFENNLLSRFGLANKHMTEEAKSTWENLKKARQDAQNELLIIDAEKQKAQRELQKEHLDEQAKLQKEADESAKKHLNKFIDELEDTYKAGLLSQEILEKNSLENQINAQLAAYEKEIDKLIAHEQLKFEIRQAAAKGVAEMQKAIEDKEKADKSKSDADKIAAEQALQTAMNNLRQQGFQTASDLISNFYGKEAQDLDERKNRLLTEQAEEVTAAGDNADAKAAIEASYAKKIKDLDNEQRALKRKQAVADKALAAFQIGVNTAVAIISALAPPPTGLGPVAGIPLSVLVGAMGALQLASVLTKPLPAFEFGTQNSPEGWAIVNEKGPEVITPKSGNPYFIESQGATLAYLEAGSKVKPADESKRLMESNMFEDTNEFFRRGDDSINRYLIDRNERVLVSALDRNFNSLIESNRDIEQAVRGNKPPNYIKRGSIMWRQHEDDQRNKKLVRDSMYNS